MSVTLTPLEAIRTYADALRRQAAEPRSAVLVVPDWLTRQVEALSDEDRAQYHRDVDRVMAGYGFESWEQVNVGAMTTKQGSAV